MQNAKKNKEYAKNRLRAMYPDNAGLVRDSIEMITKKVLADPQVVDAFAKHLQEQMDINELSANDVGWCFGVSDKQIDKLKQSYSKTRKESCNACKKVDPVYLECASLLFDVSPFYLIGWTDDPSLYFAKTKKSTYSLGAHGALEWFLDYYMKYNLITADEKEQCLKETDVENDKIIIRVRQRDNDDPEMLVEEKPQKFGADLCSDAESCFLKTKPFFWRSCASFESDPGINSCRELIFRLYFNNPELLCAIMAIGGKTKGHIEKFLQQLLEDSVIEDCLKKQGVLCSHKDNISRKVTLVSEEKWSDFENKYFASRTKRVLLRNMYHILVPMFLWCPGEEQPLDNYLEVFISIAGDEVVAKRAMEIIHESGILSTRKKPRSFFSVNWDHQNQMIHITRDISREMYRKQYRDQRSRFGQSIISSAQDDKYIEKYRKKTRKREKKDKTIDRSNRYAELIWTEIGWLIECVIKYMYKKSLGDSIKITVADFRLGHEWVDLVLGGTIDINCEDELSTKYREYILNKGEEAECSLEPNGIIALEWGWLINNAFKTKPNTSLRKQISITDEGFRFGGDWYRVLGERKVYFSDDDYLLNKYVFYIRNKANKEEKRECEQNSNETIGVDLNWVKINAFKSMLDTIRSNAIIFSTITDDEVQRGERWIKGVCAGKTDLADVDTSIEGLIDKFLKSPADNFTFTCSPLSLTSLNSMKKVNRTLQKLQKLDLKDAKLLVSHDLPYNIYTDEVNHNVKAQNAWSIVKTIFAEGKYVHIKNAITYLHEIPYFKKTPTYQLAAAYLETVDLCNTSINQSALHEFGLKLEEQEFVYIHRLRLAEDEVKLCELRLLALQDILEPNRHSVQLTIETKKDLVEPDKIILSIHTEENEGVCE